MGLIGKIRQLSRSLSRSVFRELIVDNGGGNNVAASHVQPQGFDSSPLVDDRVLLIPLPQSGRFISIGALDEKNQSSSSPGETRMYSRDSEGLIAAFVKLENNGNVTIQNENSTITATDGGDITVTNGTATLTLNPSGDITGTNGQATANLAPGGDITLSNSGSTISATSAGNASMSNTAGASVAVTPAGAISLSNAAGGGISMTPAGNLSFSSPSGASIIFAASGAISINGVMFNPGGSGVYNTHIHNDAESRPTTPPLP